MRHVYLCIIIFSILVFYRKLFIHFQETDKNKDIPKNKKEAKKKDKNPKKAIKSNEITIENIDEEYQSDDSTDSDDDQLIGEVVDKENKRVSTIIIKFKLAFKL